MIEAIKSDCELSPELYARDALRNSLEADVLYFGLRSTCSQNALRNPEVSSGCMNAFSWPPSSVRDSASAKVHAATLRPNKMMDRQQVSKSGDVSANAVIYER